MFILSYIIHNTDAFATSTSSTEAQVKIQSFDPEGLIISFSCRNLVLGR